MTDDANHQLDWTGERYVPQITGNIRLEHLHRYLVARELSAGKRVLDLACGEGYGSSLLAAVAASVVGVDIAPEVISHASRRYRRPNLEFKRGDCGAIPLSNQSVDLVVSFETIEHVHQHEEMLTEIRRVLCPGGLLIISNPERHEYTEVLGNQNPYHAHELYRDEFEALLRSTFANVAVAGQRIAAGSVLGGLVDSTPARFLDFPPAGTYTDIAPTQGVKSPLYLLALASDGPLPALPVGVLEGGDFMWPPDAAAHASRIEALCAGEIARRLGEAIELDGASADEVRAAFFTQADRVSGLVRSLVALATEVDAAKGDKVAARASLNAHVAAEEWLGRKVGRLESEVGRLESEVGRLQQSISDREKSHEQTVSEQLIHKESQIESMRTQVDALRVELESGHHRLVASHRVIGALREQISSLEKRIEAYEQSHSWRLTAPLRAVRRFGRPAAPVEAAHTSDVDLSGVDFLTVSGDEGVVSRASGSQPAKDAESQDLRAAEVASPREVTVSNVADTSAMRQETLYEEPTSTYVPLDRSVPVQTRIKTIAFYLPQFHPIPENDMWWGKGFTEWTSVTRAKPQFEGHHQPRLPGELGFYDLRLVEVQRRQIELARLYGVYGFCYYHYWFQGKKLLHRPLDQLLASPDLDFPFCLCWANENWTRRWDGRDDECLLEQEHSAEGDLDFIRDVEPALRDPRYIKVHGRPLLLVYRPELFPDPGATAVRWRSYCQDAGIGEPFLMSMRAFDQHDPRDIGFDGALEFVPNTVPAEPITSEMPHLNPAFQGVVYDYRELVDACQRRQPPAGYRLFRTVMPTWDNEARRPNRGMIFAHSSPELYGQWLESTCRWTESHVGIDVPFVFVNAWNEWAEGAHLEPDRRFGYGYLKATADALVKFPQRGTRPSIVCVSHDAHFHGGQVLALSLVRTLTTRLGYDVETLLCGPGQLTPEFEAVSRVHHFAAPGLTRADKLALVRQLYGQGARLAICNTAVVGEAVELLKEVGFSVVSLIHELPGLIRAFRLEDSVARIAKHADRVVFASAFVRDRFLPLAPELPPERCIIQPQGLVVPNEFFGRRPTARAAARAWVDLPEKTRIVIGVGYADHRKGIDLFVDVGVRVIRQMDDVAFLWVGHHEISAFGPALSTVKDEGLADRFRFPGLARNSDVFFAGADVYLMPSREDPFPNVVLQALDAGLPVVGFENVGGFQELLERGCGVVVPFGDTAAMAAAVVELLRAPERADRLARVGRDLLSREFSMVNYTRKLTELLTPASLRVSVVVPNFNYARYLPARLNSIIQQTHPPHEVLFLDDGSTDDSVAIAEAMLHSSGLSYRIIKNDANQGTYRQWLRGFREATGDLVWIAEADDDCEPELLERLVEHFARPDVVIAYCQSRQIDEDGREIAPDYLRWTADISETKWRQPYVRSGIDEISDTLAVKNTIPNVSAVLMRRMDVSGIAQRLAALRNAGDWLLYVHLLEQGRIAFVPDPLNSHRRHASSVTIGGDGLNLMREILMVQQYVVERHAITTEVQQKREVERQRTYEFLGLNSAGPPSYKDHETLRAVEWVATG